MAKFPMLLLPLLALLFANAAAASATSTAATTTASASIEMAILWVKPNASLPQGGTTRLFRAGHEDYVLLGNTIPNAFPPPPSTGSGATQTNNRSLVTAADRYLPPGTYLVELTQPHPVNTALYDRCAIPQPTVFNLHAGGNHGHLSVPIDCRPARVVFTRLGRAHGTKLFAGSVIVEFQKAANNTTTNDSFYVHFNVAREHQGYDEAGSQKFTAAHEDRYGATIKFTKLK